MVNKKSIARFATPLVILAAAYLTYSISIGYYSSRLIFQPDSVIFKRGCIQPEGTCLRINYHFPVPVGYGRAHIERLIVSDFLTMVNEQSQAKSIAVLKNILLENALSYDSSFVEYQNYYGDGSRWYIDIKYKKIFRSKKLITFRYSYSNYLGGAHSLYGCHYVNIDLKKGKILHINDIVTDMERVTQLVQKILNEKYSGSDGGNTTNILLNSTKGFPLPHEFALLKEGLLLHYNIYEIASYDQGDEKFIIPYSDIMGIIDPRYYKAINE